MAVAAELLGRKHGNDESAALTLRMEKEIRQMNEMVGLLLGQARDRLQKMYWEQSLEKQD